MVWANKRDKKKKEKQKQSTPARKDNVSEAFLFEEGFDCLVSLKAPYPAYELGLVVVATTEAAHGNIDKDVGTVEKDGTSCILRNGY